MRRIQTVGDEFVKALAGYLENREWEVKDAAQAAMMANGGATGISTKDTWTEEEK